MSKNDAPADALRRYVIRHARNFADRLRAEGGAGVPWSVRIAEEWLNSPASELPSRSSLAMELESEFRDTVTREMESPTRAAIGPKERS